MSDEAVRHLVMAGGHHWPVAARQLAELGPADAMRLLSTVGFGRIAFTVKRLPTIRLVNHLVEDGVIFVQTHLGGAVTASLGDRDTAVSYQADRIDEDSRLGWSVVVTGHAVPVTDPAQIHRFEQLLRPWVDTPMNAVIRIQPQIVGGYWLSGTDP